VDAALTVAALVRAITAAIDVGFRTVRRIVGARWRRCAPANGARGARTSRPTRRPAFGHGGAAAATSFDAARSSIGLMSLGATDPLIRPATKKEGDEDEWLAQTRHRLPP